MSQSPGCTGCGFENPVTAETCEVCGAALEAGGAIPSEEGFVEGRTSRHRARITVFMRLLAGIWFAIVFGALAVGYYSYVSGPFWKFDVRSLFVVLSPALIGGLCGYILGGAIVAASGVYPGLSAVLRGITIGLICFCSHVAILALNATLLGAVGGFRRFLGLVIYVGIFWGIFTAVPIVAVGAIAGFLLYYYRRVFA